MREITEVKKIGEYFSIDIEGGLRLLIKDFKIIDWCIVDDVRRMVWPEDVQELIALGRKMSGKEPGNVDSRT